MRGRAEDNVEILSDGTALFVICKRRSQQSKIQNSQSKIEKVLSGGQTGVDRAALDAAQQCGLPVDGWCPKGRRAEDGSIPPRYPLKETPTRAYAERTARNVRDSDGTLVLLPGPAEGGTALTLQEADRQNKPCLVVFLDDADLSGVREWVSEHAIRVVNVAGPRESEAPGVYRDACRFLERFFRGR